MGVGTPQYMPPEQGQGGKVDHRADIYSLGVVLYEMATGRVPFEAETPLAVVLKHITDPLPLPSTVNPELPEGVERVLLKAMAKEPDGRFDSAGEMADALQQAVSGEAIAIPPPVEAEVETVPPPAAEIAPPPTAPDAVPPSVTPAPVAPPRLRRLPRPAMIGAVVLVGIIAVWMSVRLWAGRTPRQRAEATAPVGSYPAGASPYGALDMAGNVYEWTHSAHVEYPYDSEDGREDVIAEEMVRRVVRGGSFDEDAEDVRCAHRLNYYPFHLNRTVGFRVVVSP